MPTVISRSEQETAEIAADLARRLGPGAVILLSGDLGAGKTAFVRGVAIGLGIDPDEVSSPTFAIVQEYRGAHTLVHVDLYRIDGAELDELGLEELGSGPAVVAIEWAEKLPRPPEGAMRVSISDRGDDTRELRIEEGDGRPEERYSDR